MMHRVYGLFVACIASTLALGVATASAQQISAAPVTVAVADFDFRDPSAGTSDRDTVHQERLRAFAKLIRDELTNSGRYRAVALACKQPPCSAGETDADTMVGDAKAAGARLLMFGGIQKLSTLIQYLKVEVVDVDNNKLVFDRLMSMRGDTDDAWHHAGTYLVRDLVEQNLPR